MSKLTNAQLNMLRSLSGEQIHDRLLPRKGTPRQNVIRSLINHGYIRAEGWQITEAGRSVLQNGIIAKGAEHE